MYDVCFRLKQSVVGLELNGDGLAALVTIPAGTDVVLASVQPASDRFATVIWKDRTIQLFSSDLGERATRAIAGSKTATPS